MASVSGTLKYDGARSANPTRPLPGIANVPIVLQNTETSAALAVYTDADGRYSFTNVPDGSYRIVEAYGSHLPNSSGSFLSAQPSGVIVSGFPPLNYIQSPPRDASNLDATTPSTLRISVSGADIGAQDILNGPVKYTPIREILDSGVIIQPNNLITGADKGTFGSFTQGSPANMGADPNPYPRIGSNFIYVQPNTVGVTPGANQYTIQNLMNNSTANIQQTWWRIADHSSGNETGRMMVINGDKPGSTIYKELVSVKPNTYYLFSSWILNLAKSPALVNPELGVEVRDQNNNVLYTATLGTLIPMKSDVPEWKQIGTIISSQNNTSLTVRFTSMGPENFGNDYAIDDISLSEVIVSAYTPIKKASAASVKLGDIVTYTVTLMNSGMNPLTEVLLRDAIPDGFSFVQGSVVTNGVSTPDANPDIGFSVPDIHSGTALTVVFSARAVQIPTVNPTVNRAHMSYSYTPVTGGIPVVYNRISNDVHVEVVQEIPPEKPSVPDTSADLSLSKSADPVCAIPGSPIVFTLMISNAGPGEARDTIVIDPIPNEILFPEYSTDGGMSWNEWRGSLNLGTLPPGSLVKILIRGRIDPCAICSFANTAELRSVTPDNRQDNNISKAVVDILNLGFWFS